MKRRKFIDSVAVGLSAISLGFKPSKARKTHLITFSFDDGFRKSFLQLAEMHEQAGLNGCFNIIASGHLPEFQQVDDWILPDLMGSFEDWNYLVSKGHEVMPHSWKHLNLARQNPETSKQLISKCIDYFDEHLDHFDKQRAVFNFPFNASTDELDQYTLKHVRAVRNWGDGEINPLPTKKTNYILGCRSNGPGNNDAWLDDKIRRFLKTPGGWMIFNLHGLDDEGWGPVSAVYFNNLLEELVTIKYLEIIPTGMALDKYGS